MRITLVLVALAAMLVVAAPVSAKVRKLEATLSGANEMPAADPDGSGSAKLRLDRAKKRICFTIRVRNIAPVQAAHIHKGGKNVASGPIVVPLVETPQSSNKMTGCHAASRKTIRAILRHPRRYYVNVHNADFPAGALRGQLHRP